MTQNEVFSFFSSAVQSVASSIADYAVDPERDFTRTRKLPPDSLITFLVSEGSLTTKNELLDFFSMHRQSPSASAFLQQREKLRPEALYSVLRGFNQLVDTCIRPSKYRFLAADGSTATFFSYPKYSPPEYYVEPCHSAKGFYSIHINAFYDLKLHTYTDALLQPVHEKDEFRAFCTIVDRHPVLQGSKNVYIGDRGYCSYNNMAHVINSGQFFLFRTKDIHQKGLVGKFRFPDKDSFDITVDVTLVRSRSAKIDHGTNYRRFVDRATSFDFLEYGSDDTFDLSFRIVRFQLPDESYECLVTNLPEDEFPMDGLKILYFSRWGIESSFRKLKYTIGLSNFHTYKPEHIKQEIWARMIAYNLTETMINQVTIKKKDRKYPYKVNFSVAAHICRVSLRPTAEGDPIDVIALLEKELIPIRNDRHFKRLQTAHFRRPRYFIYRAA